MAGRRDPLSTNIKPPSSSSRPVAHKVKVVAPTNLQGNDQSQTVPQGNAASKPVLSPSGGSFFSSVFVTMTTETPGAEVHYTLDGSNPSLATPLYTGPVLLSANTEVRARAFRPDLVTSGDDTEQYNITLAATFLLLEDLSDFLQEDGTSKFVLEVA
jgi:hypothetical protein